MRVLFTILCVGATGLLLTGCGHPDKPGAAAAGADTPGAAIIAANGVISYPDNDYYEHEKGVSGGTLRISTSIDLVTFDLHATSSAVAQWLGRLVYDNLVYLDAQGRITPWLAKSWTISPDGKTYTFHLRDDVTFSDGTKFNAEAVRINLEHMRAPATKSPLAGNYIKPYADGKVIDEYTFEAHLRTPYVPFLNVLAQSWLGMESPKAIKENPKGIVQAPAGSGPFLLEKYTRQESAIFVRRPDYHWAPDYLQHQGPAYLDRIEITIVSEPLIRYTSLTSGQYDFTLEAPVQNAAGIRRDKSLIFSNRIRMGVPMRGFAFNTTRPPFDDIQVRRAVALAIDREGITRIAGFGEYAPKADFLAANTQYYDRAYRNVLHYDPAEANRLLDADGWTTRDAEGYRTKNGQRLAAELRTTAAASGGAANPTVVAIQSNLKDVGFALKLVPSPASQYTQARLRGDYQLASAGVWHTNTPDALYIIYDSHSISTPSQIGQNSSHLHDDFLDDVLERARASPDSDERARLYSQAQKRLTELVPDIPLYDFYSTVAYKRYVRNVLFDTSHNTPVFTAVWLDKAQQ